MSSHYGIIEVVKNQPKLSTVPMTSDVREFTGRQKHQR
jgi:hypothetical protein